MFAHMRAFFATFFFSLDYAYSYTIIIFKGAEENKIKKKVSKKNVKQIMKKIIN